MKYHGSAFVVIDCRLVPVIFTYISQHYVIVIESYFPKAGLLGCLEWYRKLNHVDTHGTMLWPPNTAQTFHILCDKLCLRDFTLFKDAQFPVHWSNTTGHLSSLPIGGCDDASQCIYTMICRFVFRIFEHSLYERHVIIYICIYIFKFKGHVRLCSLKLVYYHHSCTHKIYLHSCYHTINGWWVYKH